MTVFIAEKDLELRGPVNFWVNVNQACPNLYLLTLRRMATYLAQRNEAGWILEQNDQNHINLLLSLFERDSAVKFSIWLDLRLTRFLGFFSDFLLPAFATVFFSALPALINHLAATQYRPTQPTSPLLHSSCQDG